MTDPTPIGLIGIGLLCCLGGSCGYKVGFQAKREIRSIAVPIFRNRTLRRGFEFTLADALRREILQRTHLRLADPDEADAILQGEILTVKEGVLIKVKEDLFFHKRILEDLESQLMAFLKEKGEISTPQFKDMTGASRKYTIPLIEYFDKSQVTVRVGDTRILRKK